MAIAAERLKPGDTILPPPREVRLWMRRTLVERGLPESALWLKVREIEEGRPDKGGRWLIISADHSAAWSDGSTIRSMRFKVRPETCWQKIEKPRVRIKAVYGSAA